MKKMSRRSFVTASAVSASALGAGAATLGLATLGQPSANAQSSTEQAHPKLVLPPVQAVELAADWNSAPFYNIVHDGAHIKQVFDSVKFSHEPLEHMRNSLNGLQFGFGIAPEQIKVVAVLSGLASFMNFDDSIWKRYAIGSAFHVADPKTGQPAQRNIFYPSHAGPNGHYASTDPESAGSLYDDSSMEALARRGVRFMVCHNAALGLAGYLAKNTQTTESRDAIYQEMVTHLIPHAVLVPAAVAALALLQSEGHYSYLYV